MSATPIPTPEQVKNATSGVESVQVEPSNPEKQQKKDTEFNASVSAAKKRDDEERERKAAELKAELASREFIRPIAGRPIMFQRWGWITATRILPQLLGIAGAIFRLARAQSANSKLTKEQMEKIVLDGDLAASLTPKMMEDFISLQAETLAAAPMNRMSLSEAHDFLKTLEVDEGFELIGYIYKQNAEMIAKNVLRLIRDQQ